VLALVEEPRRSTEAPNPVKENLQRYAHPAAVVIVVIGCHQGSDTFAPSFLSSEVASASTWPMFTRVCGALGGRSVWQALLMSPR